MKTKVLKKLEEGGINWFLLLLALPGWGWAGWKPEKQRLPQAGKISAIGGEQGTLTFQNHGYL